MSLTQWYSGGHVGLDDPEADPGAHDDEGEREVDAEHEEAGLPLKVKLEEGNGVVAEPAGYLPAKYKFIYFIFISRN